MDIQELEKNHMAFVRALRKKVWQVQQEFNIVEEGDKVLVCLSGGKDSYTMLDMLMNLKRAMNDSFEIEVFHLDQKQPGYPVHILPDYLNEYGVSFKIMERNTYRIVVEKLKPEQQGSNIRICQADQCQQNCARASPGRRSGDFFYESIFWR